MPNKEWQLTEKGWDRVSVVEKTEKKDSGQAGMTEQTESKELFSEVDPMKAKQVMEEAQEKTKKGKGEK